MSSDNPAETPFDGNSGNAPDPKFPWRKFSAFVLAALTIGAVYYNWEELWPTLKEVDLFWLLFGIALHLVNYYFTSRGKTLET